MVIASELKSRGFHIDFNDDSDVVAIRGLDVISAECKRLKSTTSLQRNLKKACKQLNSRERKDTYGLIFVDITSCLSDKVPIYEYSNDLSMKLTVERAMKQYLDENLKIIEPLCDRYLDSFVGVCMTFKRMLWFGVGTYQRVNYYTDMNIFMSKHQSDEVEKKLCHLLSKKSQ